MYCCTSSASLSCSLQALPEERLEAAYENGFVASYIHAGGKIGVLVDVETDVVNDAIKEMAKNVAMQAAALKPLYTNDSEVDADYIAKEKEILTVAAKNEKPDANDKIISGMVMGRIKKELKEICLLDQVYVKAEDGKQSVAQYVAQRMLLRVDLMSGNIPRCFVLF